MKGFLLFPVCSALIACQVPAAAAPAYCGESFCINTTQTISVSKTTPVEDFNLYKIEFNKRTYQIYEGNYPQPPGQLVRRIRSEGSETVDLYRSNGIITLKFDRGRPKNPVVSADERIPRYLMAWTRCPASEECSLPEFWNLINPSEKLLTGPGARG
jgi:hypothetical protein